MKPRLNLATAPLENQRRFFAVALGVGLPALLIFVLLIGATYSDWRATRERRAEVAQLQADLRDYKDRREELEKSFAAPETKRAMERAAFLNGLIEQRSFPWTRMFMDLERELPTGVHVVSLSPRMQAGGVEVHMVVGADSDRGKLEFLRSLENAKEFTHLVVVSESRPSRQEDAADAVKVELVAQYAAPEEKETSPAKAGKIIAQKPEPMPSGKALATPAAKIAGDLAGDPPVGGAAEKRAGRPPQKRPEKE
jgi:Tfp pilus assembly protein PilN